MRGGRVGGVVEHGAGVVHHGVHHLAGHALRGWGKEERKGNSINCPVQRLHSSYECANLGLKMGRGEQGFAYPDTAFQSANVYKWSENKSNLALLLFMLKSY